MIFQKTIQKEISLTGLGLHTGESVRLVLKPGEDNSGIIFCRKDLKPSPKVKVSAEFITDTTLCSTLEKGNLKIMTIEHLMSALHAYGIENIIINVYGPELPILDGSSIPYLHLIKSAGIKNLPSEKKFIKVKKAIKYEHDGKFAMLEPANSFVVDFSIQFPHPVFAERNNEITLDLYKDSYFEQISRARTFGFMQEVEYLRSIGLARGGSLDNAIVMDDYNILNRDGLRYEDEFVRHKVLDAIGDLYIEGLPILGKFTGFKSGHEMNNQLLRLLIKDKKAYEVVSIKDTDETIYSNIANYYNQLEYKNDERVGSL